MTIQNFEHIRKISGPAVLSEEEAISYPYKHLYCFEFFQLQELFLLLDSSQPISVSSFVLLLHRHYRLLTKLENYGIKGNTLRIISDFFNRQTIAYLCMRKLFLIERCSFWGTTRLCFGTFAFCSFCQ